MKLHHLTDETLLQETENLVKEEREILTKVLHHLREIERRRLFSALGFPSLFAYAVAKLGYPDDQAYRRIAAMRLLSELPEVEEKLSMGALSLTSLSLAKTVFRKKETTRAKKLEILSALENKSTREAEKILAEYAPSPPKPDKVKSLSKEDIELRFTASESVQEKIETLKGLLAHKHPDLSLGELFEKLCDLGLETWSKTKFAAPRKVETKAATKRAAFTKAQNRCERCHSRYALEIDHKIPKARGGSSTPENLRLLCRSCNQRAAIEVYGIHKMAPYLQKGG